MKKSMNKLPAILSILLSSIFTISFVSADSAKIVNPINNHTYKRFDTPKTQKQAKNDCASQKGYLATITSQSENNWVWNSFGSGAGIYAGVYRGFWLGGSDLKTEGHWQWITGEAWNYSNWGTGQPDNGGTGQSYNIMWNNNVPGSWDDSGLPRLNDKTSYLCEWNTSTAGKSFAWNISRVMLAGMTSNPQGTWAFMENTSGIDKPENYTLLPIYSKGCVGRGALNCWVSNTVNKLPLIGVATKTFTIPELKHEVGMPLLHPGENTPVILRWKSPINGKVNVMGRVSAISCCGDGINWSLKNKNAAIIRSGYLSPSQGSTFLAQDIAIKAGESLYFAVDMNGTILSDSTNLDMLITSQQ